MKSLWEGCKKGFPGSKQWNLQLVVYKALGLPYAGTGAELDGLFQTWDNLSFLISFRCKNHKDYPFDAEYWRKFPAFLQTSWMFLLLPMSCLRSFFTASEPPFFFLFPPQRYAVYVLDGFALFSFLEEGNTKMVLKSTLCGLVDCLWQTACLELVSRKYWESLN